MRKGKARQVEDDDEEMRNSDIENEEKGKDRQVEDGDEEMKNSESYSRSINAKQVENEETDGDFSDINFNFDEEEPVRPYITPDSLLLSLSKGPSSVPRPYKFSKPKGGAGPRPRAQTPLDDRGSGSEPDEPDDPLYTNSNSDFDDDPPHPLNNIPNSLNLPHDALVALTNTVLGVIGQRDDLCASRMKRRRITSEKIKQPTIRASMTRRKQLGVRRFVDQKTPADESY
jgi:hypothetical protein